jgi:hypothetical protein
VFFEFLRQVGYGEAVKREAARVTQWRTLDQHYAVGEFSLQLLGWDRPRRFGGDPRTTAR